MVRTRHSTLAAAAADDEQEARRQLERSEEAVVAAAAAAVAADAIHDESNGVEAELTSLTWLQSLDITTASGLPTPPCSPTPPLPPPPPPKQPPKKMSPLLKAQLGSFTTYYLSLILSPLELQ